MSQTHVPSAPQVDPDDIATGAPSNVDAHMPPQPGNTEAPTNPIYRGATWNPDTNEWAPSNEQHAVFGVAEPDHTDEAFATPLPDDQGDPRTYPPQGAGSTPDARLNLIDSVRAPQPVPLPVQRIEHVVITQEQSASLVRPRVVRVQGTQPTVILDELPTRSRAVLKAITTSGIVVLQPLRQGGGVASTAIPAGPGAGFPLATGDPPLVVESGAGVEALVANTGASTFCDIAVWEEVDAPAPGLV